MKKNSFTLKKVRSRQNLAKTISGGDYADVQVFPGNTPAQAESLQRSVAQAAKGIWFIRERR